MPIFYDKLLAEEDIKHLMNVPVPKHYKIKQIGNIRALCGFDKARMLVLLRFDMKIGDDQHGINYEIPEIIGKPLEKYIKEKQKEAKNLLEKSW